MQIQKGVLQIVEMLDNSYSHAHNSSNGNDRELVAVQLVAESRGGVEAWYQAVREEALELQAEGASRPCRSPTVSLG